ncbi:MAG TPA: alpha/beta hydrolase-fold protein [Gaiellaceae bacterium]|nr:alpha/beta hydrolase-fold protein [Gaiellaceae bacterium]
MTTVLRHPGFRVAAAGGAVLAAFVAVGLLGLRSYLDNYLSYRGFAPPREPAFVKQPGTVHRLLVPSAALGGRSQEAYVYLPSGYAEHPHRRYPVLYLLHGFPGRPLAFLQTVQMGVVDDTLTARHRAKPLILVMPFGSTGTFTDEEWVNGVSPKDGWATFVARDLVHYVDAHFRTIARASGRAIGGLSEGGYGAINIALHHPHEFSVVESWSGYQRPDHLHAIFGSRLQLLTANDPRRLLPRVAPELRKLGTFFWFYSGSTDPLRRENAAFARELTAERLPHRYFETYGGHNWAIWRDNARAADLAAASRLA